jgi:hypothetical protein
MDHPEGARTGGSYVRVCAGILKMEVVLYEAAYVTLGGHDARHAVLEAQLAVRLDGLAGVLPTVLGAHPQLQPHRVIRANASVNTTSFSGVTLSKPAVAFPFHSPFPS